jgi:hypothetical protein
MKLYVRLEFSPDGSGPFDVIQIMNEIGFAAVLGDYDFVFEYAQPQAYKVAVQTLHDRLKGTGVRYSIVTKRE